MGEFKKLLTFKIILFTYLLSLILGDLTPLKGKVISGVYWEEAHLQPLLYEKVVPLIFEFRLRSDLWNNLPLGYNKFKVLPRLNCKSDNKSATISTSDWFFSCPVFFHVHDFLKQYKSNYTDINPAVRSSPSRQNVNSPQEYQKFTNPSIQFEDCEQVISRSWKGIYGRDTGLADYRSIIEKCNTLPNYFEEQIPDYNYDVGTIFDSIKDNFASYFFLNSSNPDPGQMINNLLGIQTLHLINTYSELTRFREAVLSCQNHLIPYSYLKTARLEKALHDIRLKLIPLKYILSTGSIQKLLKMPIADCIFGSTTMSVQILLPAIRIETNFNLLKFTYPQFLYKNQLCRVKSSESNSKDSQYFLHDRTTKTLVETECRSTDKDFCLTPDQSRRPLVNKCIYEVLNASFSGIRNYCSFECQKLSPEYKKLILPIIQRVSPTKFVITVDRITTMLIKCEGKPDELITPQIYGAVEITLPCNCHLMYHSERFYSRSPCGNSLFVKHVIPEHMINSSLAKESKFFLLEPLEKVNFSLFSEDEINLIDLNRPIDPFNGSDSPDDNYVDDRVQLDSTKSDSLFILPSHNHQICFQSHVYVWLFLAFQSIIIIIVFVLLYLKLNSLIKKCEYGRSAVCFSVSQMTNLDDK